MHFWAKCYPNARSILIPSPSSLWIRVNVPFARKFVVLRPEDQLKQSAAVLFARHLDLRDNPLSQVLS